MQIILDNCRENREQWLELRKGKMGGSLAYDAANVDAAADPLNAYLELAGLKPAFEGNDNTYFGSQLEDWCAEEFGRQYCEKNPGTELKLERADCLIQDPTTRWRTATPDYFAYINGEKVLLQLKCTKAMFLSDWENGRCPNRYRAQVLHELKCLQGEVFRAFIGVFVYEPAYRYCEIPADPKYINELCRREAILWEHFERKQPPPIKHWNPEQNKSLFWEHDGAENIVIPAEHKKFFVQYKQAAADEKDAQKRKTDAAAAILQTIGKHYKGVCGEWKATVVRKEFVQLDVKTLREKAPKTYQGLLAKYPSPQRQIYPLISGGPEDAAAKAAAPNHATPRSGVRVSRT